MSLQIAAALAVAYIIGFNVSYWMLLTEHKAEGLPYTHGDRIICLLISILSWAAVLWALSSAWIGSVQRTGYWNRPVDDKQPAAKLNGQVKQRREPA